MSLLRMYNAYVDGSLKCFVIVPCILLSDPAADYDKTGSIRTY